jgi:hypothetical protein
LLATLTANPPLGAAALNVIEQSSVPAAVIDELPQLSPLNTGGFALSCLAAFSCSANVSTSPPALAVNVTVCGVLTAGTLTAKLADVDPAATVAEAGTVTEASLLDSPIANPPLGAAAFSVAVQLSVPAPVIDELAQLKPPKVAAAVAAVPVPLIPIIAVPLFEPLLVIVNCPPTAPVASGEKLTLML